jgi:hypothetical protein
MSDCFMVVLLRSRQFVSKPPPEVRADFVLGHVG